MKKDSGNKRAVKPAKRQRQNERKSFPDEGREAELDRMLHGDGLPEEFPPLVPSIIDRGLIALELPTD